FRFLAELQQLLRQPLATTLDDGVYPGGKNDRTFSPQLYPVRESKYRFRRQDRLMHDELFVGPHEIISAMRAPHQTAASPRKRLLNA
ncbi:MAG: hypothetical protein ACYCPD_11250, partial [Acidobacteriaceae bacterium]